MTKTYIVLHVYDYDLDGRHRTVRHECRDLAHAEHLRKRLWKLTAHGRTAGWLERNHHIYGQVLDTGDGVYEETTRRVA